MIGKIKITSSGYDHNGPPVNDPTLMLSADQIKAMEAIFSLNEAMGTLTLGDLIEAVRAAVNTGHDMLCISLSMAAIAVERAKETA